MSRQQINAVRQLYAKYIVFTSQPETDVKDWSNKNREFMQDIVQHASQWKGLRAPPDMNVLAKLCTIHGLQVLHTMTKEHRMQILIQKLVSQIRKRNAAYVLPIAKTAVAKRIFRHISRPKTTTAVSIPSNMNTETVNVAESTLSNTTHADNVVTTAQFLTWNAARGQNRRNQIVKGRGV